MADMRGMYVTQPSTQRGQSKAPPARVTWATHDGIFKSSLTPVVVNAPAASPEPGATDDTRADPDAQAHEEARLRQQEHAACPRT